MAGAAGHGRYGAVMRRNQVAGRPLLLTIALALVLLLAPSAGSAADTIRLVALGDSLTAGYGLAPEAAFPARLETALREKGHDVTVENAGVSGDTASGGLERLDWSVPDGTDAVIVALGANDALRGLDPSTTREALETIVARLIERNIQVLLAGMYAPPNLGEEYGEAFASIYSDLADANDIVFYPFFLKGVAAREDLNLEDGMHPNEEGIAEIVERILPAVEELISRVEAG